MVESFISAACSAKPFPSGRSRKGESNRNGGDTNTVSSQSMILQKKGNLDGQVVCCFGTHI
ncbi:hypothetical protein BT93_K2271 [Corymbia citriodora subsp. variegata]|nr:hypothetical protein BT93_K2271 [Corymbia citriodora subsp. variegata]